MQNRETGAPEHCFSNLNMHQITWETCWNADNDSYRSGVEPEISIFNELSGIANTVGNSPSHTFACKDNAQ